MTTIELDSRTVEVSRPDKVLFPDDGITKADLANYYRRVAEVMLPHLKDRPLVLHRFPDGIDGNDFLQKNATGRLPEWARTVEVPRRGGGSIHQLVADDSATLVLLADQAVIALHVLLTRADRLDHPDQLVFDLDPHENDLSAVPDAAAALHELLDELEVPSFPKATGSRGVHVHVPLDRSADVDAARRLARRVADLLVLRHPDDLTTEQRKNRRGRRLFVDTLRNGYGQHAIAPYGVRPLPSAPVAVPLDWDEATGRFDPRRYTVTNLFRRLGQKADPWSEFLEHPIALSELDTRLSQIEGGRNGARR